MKLKAKRIQKGAAAQHAVMPADASRDVGERIGRIGDDEEECVRRNCNDTGNDISVNRRIGTEQP
jgi:hypothetical protein